MSFDPFGDFEVAGYLQNSLQLKDPVEVKESEHLSFEASIEDALAFLENEPLIDYGAVLKVHEILFSAFYHWAGRDRNELVPHLAVFKGVHGDPDSTVFEHPAQIRLAVDYALNWQVIVNAFETDPAKSWGSWHLLTRSWTVMGALSCWCSWSSRSEQVSPSIGQRRRKTCTCVPSVTKFASLRSGTLTAICSRLWSTFLVGKSGLGSSVVSKDWMDWIKKGLRTKALLIQKYSKSTKLIVQLHKRG